jgi:hypothetical protein
MSIGGGVLSNLFLVAILALEVEANRNYVAW